jgi:hypothetical protein
VHLLHRENRNYKVVALSEFHWFIPVYQRFIVERNYTSMSRTIIGVLNAYSREAARAERARQREIVRLRAAAARQLKADLREAKLQEKQAKQDYLESRQNEALELTQAIRDTEQAISQLLLRAIRKKPAVLVPPLKTFIPGRFDGPQIPDQPKIEDFPPQPLGFFSSLLPGAAKRRDTRVKVSKEQYDIALWEGGI